MVVKISNKDIHRYTFKKRKIYLKSKKIKSENISFGEVLGEIQVLKEKGIITIENVSIYISKAIMKIKK